ncbi:MAG TPA: hypothetical protein VMS84_07850 [Mycobacterium sp.]|jgi:hypothetical protein|nr:hypothetical protein [Mycobacterium sp.]
MTCICDFDEHDWPSMEPGCPVHDRPKTLSERFHALWDRLWR